MVSLCYCKLQFLGLGSSFVQPFFVAELFNETFDGEFAFQYTSLEGNVPKTFGMPSAVLVCVSGVFVVRGCAISALIWVPTSIGR